MTAPQGGATHFFFFARFCSRRVWGPRGVILWGTLRTQKAVPHLGLMKIHKIGTKWLRKHRNSTWPNQNCSKFQCESSRDDGNVPGPLFWAEPEGSEIDENLTPEQKIKKSLGTCPDNRFKTGFSGSGAPAHRPGPRQCMAEHRSCIHAC